jgi:hypothetical protein
MRTATVGGHTWDIHKGSNGSKSSIGGLNFATNDYPVSFS